MASKRKTAEQKREEWERRDERYGRSFLRDLAEAKTFRDLYVLANKTRTTQGDPGDRYHHWLGCALNQNPYDDAPKDVQAAIKVALARTKEGT